MKNTEGIYVKKKRGKGKAAKSSVNKSSKWYKKPYKGQGR